tara:strand:- start:1 stop:312 length:312 start_codon:yes stop_codon:yes gene_type:complete
MDNLLVAFAKWHKDEGVEVEQEIEDEITKTLPMFDSADGTHSKWVTPFPGASESLGVLLMLSEDECADLMCAWEEAQEGDMTSGAFIAGWLAHFMKFIDTACS